MSKKIESKNYRFIAAEFVTSAYTLFKIYGNTKGKQNQLYCTFESGNIYFMETESLTLSELNEIVLLLEVIENGIY